jgi:hypothetical protein
MIPSLLQPLPASVRRVFAAALLGVALPMAALAAPSPSAPAAAASQPSGPTIGADIASKCKAMSGDERTACERDTRHAAAHRRASHRHAHAASASH